MSAIVEYFEALKRLQQDKPLRVRPGTKITNDAVALEAGRKKGSIKKSREAFTQLIEAIQEAAQEQAKPRLTDKEKAANEKAKAQHYRQLYEEALGREIMLIRRIYQLEAELSASTSSRKNGQNGSVMSIHS